MATSRRRTSGIFPGVVLISAGILLLLHNYRGLDLLDVLFRWWPLVLIFLGVIKVYERVVASRSEDPGWARISVGEILLVIGMLALMSAVVGVDYGKRTFGGKVTEMSGDLYPFDLDVTPLHVPANARITVRGARGNITVRAADTSDIRVSGQKNVHAWSESDAQRRAGPVSVEIVQNGDGYEVRPANASDSRISIDMDIQVPPKATVTVRNEEGDITISDLTAPVAVTSEQGDVEVRNTGGDVNIETDSRDMMHRNDVAVSDTKGDVKISGRGGEVTVASASGSFTLNGDFVGPVRADKIAKGMRFISNRTDLTLTQLSGHMEASSGNLEVVDAPGDLTLRTNRYSVDVENATGKIKIENRGGDVELRFSSPPKEDIDVNNSNASVSLTLPESASFNIRADCRSCDVNSEFSADTLKKTSSESGDGHLEGHYGSGRGPQITLRTSYGSISIHKTS
jgi:Putative adhesin/Domain of unknown function (DUF5668)